MGKIRAGIPFPFRLRQVYGFIMISKLIFMVGILGQAYVIDGDTIEVDGTRVRLWGIDAPEWGQAGYFEARDALIFLTRQQTVTCDPMNQDRYGRTVARCEVEGEDLAEALIRGGVARPYCRFSGGFYDNAARAGGVRECGE